MVARIRAVPTWGRFAKLCGVLVGAVSLSTAMTASALAQNSPFVTVTPTKNTGGFVYGLAVIMAVLGVLIVVAVVGAYLRYAPRFQRDEGATSVRAARVVPGREPPRRAVDVSQAAPVVVAPPAVAAPAAAAPAAQPRAAPASQPAAARAAAPASAPPAAAAAPAPAPTPAAATAPAEASAPAPSEAPAPPAPAPSERPEVALDQEVFDAKLAELLQKGTDRRVAEGQARRAAMIAARKKAEG
jgi:uncharacterized membrane protein